MQDRGEWLDYDIRIGPEKKRDRKNAKRRDQNAEKECCWGWFTWSELITVIYWTNKFLVDRWISRVSRAHFDAAAPLKMRKCGEDGRNRIMRPFFFFFLHLNVSPSIFSSPPSFFLRFNPIRGLRSLAVVELNDVRSVLDSKEKRRVVVKRGQQLMRAWIWSV